MGRHCNIYSFLNTTLPVHLVEFLSSSLIALSQNIIGFNDLKAPSITASWTGSSDIIRKRRSLVFGRLADFECFTFLEKDEKVEGGDEMRKRITVARRNLLIFFYFCSSVTQAT